MLERGRFCGHVPEKILNSKITEFESWHVELYHYVLGNRGIIFPLTLVVHVYTTDRYSSLQCIMNEDN